MNETHRKNAFTGLSWALTLVVSLASSPCLAEAQRSQDIVDSIGVNVHVMYMDSSYAKLDRVIAALDYLGIRKLRDHAPNGQPLTVSRYKALAEAGFRFDFVVNSGDVQIISDRLARFADDHPRSIDSIEGPNEVNNWPINFNGLSGHKAAIAYQHELYQAVKAHPKLAGIPIYNFTDYPQPAGDADYMNLHPYPKHGAQPYVWLAQDLAIAAGPMPGKPRVITETGYPEMPEPQQWNGPAEWNPVDERSQAILTLNLLLDSGSLGAHRTYLYQLLDGYQDQKNKDFDSRFGLFDFTYRPKAAATAVRNLLSLLEDTSGSAHTFSIRKAAISLQNLPSTARSLMLEKADGTDLIVLWNEQKIWDSRNRASLSIPPAKIELTISNGPRVLTVYDPLRSQSAITMNASAVHASIDLSDRPIVIAVCRR